MNKNLVFLIIAVISAALMCLPWPYIFPVFIIIFGFFIGVFLSMHKQEKLKDYIFLSGVFIMAFLTRIIAAFLLYNFVFLLNGNGLLGDGQPYAENGYKILRMWLIGIHDIDYISNYLISDISNASGTVGSYDFWNAIVYYFAGVNPMSLILINCLAGSLTAVIVFFITEQVFSKKAARYASVLTAFWPSLFFWSVQNLKEPISVFLIVVLIWSALQLKIQFRFYLIALFIAFSFAVKEFRSLLFFAFFAISIPLSFLLSLWKTRKAEFIFFIILVLFLIFMFFTVLKAYLLKILPFGSLSMLDWISEMRSYRAYGGSAFLENWKFTNPADVGVFLPIALLIAWLAPFPWEISSMIQIMAMPEMLLYYILLPAMFSGWYFIMKYKMKEGGAIIAYIFVMMLIFAFIEGNVGTLFRHRSMVLPFIFILIGAGLSFKTGKEKTP
ncbi:MAG: hypothetical protein COZ98_03060 [Candidatus Omnitrophica bacterium CG_4_8_14_3_um_filter_43_15]|nr:MAG: hypothetical protein COS29_00120 [Candidatus Omnitrophica bacterium CG02_land_8_20_14_3_00__42_8]PIW68417.1 MAG: hypothetical protein COW10_02670 [Candidatus Omnitrophica bacterium CG12_big_fil_rev_8_21_14_0_65_42_8]PIW80286.1 MAG: hypothetical protein COZ98_03060 [Candidatus Omnitrophica bacterium CG_4_8_14_3_um_filter_43_15]